MGSIIVAKDQLRHFSHYHVLNLVHFQPNHKNENDDDDDEDEDENEENFVEEDSHGGQCNMCNEQIFSFHLCYYRCKSCDYSLHKFCAELPQTQQNNPLHPGHNLEISFADDFEIKCCVCNLNQNIAYYECDAYDFRMDIICATMSEQTINHPSHPHHLARLSGYIVSSCVACGNKHEGVFFQCATCPGYRINQECALLPAKLLIQHHTNEAFTHLHPLVLAYSFPQYDLSVNFYPNCRLCDDGFESYLWVYKCDKCRYYVHVDCATSRREPFQSIFLPAGIGKTHKNFKEDEHLNLLHCPFHDEGDNLLKHHHMSNQKEFTRKQNEVLSSHQHPLILFNNQTLVDGKKVVSLHDPMKRIQLLCDGCVKPIMTLPFYMCNEYVDKKCCFVLHEWCAKLPLKVQDYADHPEHTLFLMPKVNSKFFGVFKCAVCKLPSTGFAYGCTMCEYYVDTNCAFIPEEITHDSHPDHLLSKLYVDDIFSNDGCKACDYSMSCRWGFHCPSCDFYIHVECALLLPRLIKHKCDIHPLSLRYNPAENHISKYICEVCEDELNPWRWFYHCTTCAQSMHSSCVPIKLQYEQASSRFGFNNSIYKFLNVKFGGTLEIKHHSHHLFSFVQGLKSDGDCFKCDRRLWCEMIFKCLECKFALHYNCASSFVN